MKKALLLSLLLLPGCAGPALFGIKSWPPQGAAEEPTVAWQRGPGSAGATGPGLVAGQGAAHTADAAHQDPATPLYGWDGAVVDGRGTTEVVPGGQHIHSLQPEPTGRLHIIELYQQVLDERDALAEEVGILTAALEKTESLLGATGKDVRRLEERIVELELRTGGLADENRDLAARLTTAQIRRLEAERLLLETRIEVHRARIVPVPQGAGDGVAGASSTQGGGQ